MIAFMIASILFAALTSNAPCNTIWTNMGVNDLAVTPLAFDSNHDVLYAASYGNGIWRCTSPSSMPSWSQIKEDGHSPSLYDSVHNVLFVVCGDGIWKCTNPESSPSWTVTGPELSQFAITSLAYDSTHDVLYAATDWDSESGVSGIWRCMSVNTKPSWGPIGGADNPTWIGSLAYDQNHDILYASTVFTDVWRCTTPATSPHWVDAGGPMYNINGITYDAGHDILFAATAGGTLKCSNPSGTQCWQEIRGKWGWLKASSIVYDPSHDILFEVSAYEEARNWYGNKVWRCANPGTSPSWTYTGLYTDYISAIVCDQLKGNLYASTNEGLMSSCVAIPLRDFSSSITSSVPIVAERPMYSDYNGWTGGTDVIGATDAASTFYFAEGTCRPNFDPYITISNPGVADAYVVLTYTKGDGAISSQDIVVPPKSRATVHPPDLIGVGEGSANDFSTIVQCTNGQSIVAERPMYFNYKGTWNGASDAVGATSVAKEWYFAEGNTLQGFDEYVTVLNPGEKIANLVFRYMVEGEGAKDVSGIVGPHSRATFKTIDQIGANKNASLMLSSDQGVVAERPVYFNYHGVWSGGHDVIGARSPSTDWYFAEGTTRNNSTDGSFEEWLCLQNPTDAMISVTATYQLAAGQGDPAIRTYRIPAKQRLTIKVNDELGDDKDASIELSSNAGFIAERPMYFDFHNKWTGGHDVVGSTSPSKTYYFAEGTGRTNFEPYFCLQNPGTVTANVTITYMGSNGWRTTQQVTVAPHSRSTISANDIFISGY